jgi:metacaspase-1
MTMAKGISLHIGLNRVDPAHYEGWDGTLNACEADARDMQALAKSSKFKPMPLLLTAQATAKAVSAAIKKAAKTLVKGDIFFMTYSGHGGQVRDTNGDEDDDRMDETWVLFDRQLVDDELYALWGGFKAGVRIVVFSDSCHSGSVVRMAPPMISGGPRERLMPRQVGEKVEAAHQALYRGIQAAHPGAEKATVKASILLISGCMDNQTSLDGEHNGAFTEMLLKVWNGGKFRGSYRRFRDTIVSRMPASQSPNYFFVGAPDRAFEAQRPFKI